MDYKEKYSMKDTVNTFVGDVYCWECTGKFCDTVDDIRHTRRRCDVGSSACQMFITGMKAEIH